MSRRLSAEERAALLEVILLECVRAPDAALLSLANRLTREGVAALAGPYRPPPDPLRLVPKD